MKLENLLRKRSRHPFSLRSVRHESMNNDLVSELGQFLSRWPINLEKERSQISQDFPFVLRLNGRFSGIWSCRWDKGTSPNLQPLSISSVADLEFL
ncbi:hypothetical protein CEXT_394491 [Caerostris extrusa]|uniref:Uncharacterized protein n=1 Tax=Caerostris extrusa TaxID=172846 RepID=A0AAV4TDT0_CAEEX|nr:hypothetical protein CEXT_394491 [Caerostris extrusa]